MPAIACAFRSCKFPTLVFQLLRRALSTTSASAPADGSLTSQKVLVDGCNIHVDRAGNGEHAVLLLPGALGSSRTDFSPQLEKLNREKFTLFAWDPPGYGLSRPPERTWPKDFFHRDADAAAKVIRALGLRNVSLLGWSDGGITALVMAVLYPELVRKLVVWGANAYVTERDVELYERVRDVAAWSPRMREPYELLYGRRYFEEHWHRWIDAMKRYLTESDGDIIKSRVHLIDCPTLIVHGADDPLVPIEHPDFLRAHIRHSRLITMPMCKHNLHLRSSDEFNKLVTDFLVL